MKLMRKPNAIGCLFVMVLFLALPAVASASKIEVPSGTTAPKGTKLTANVSNFTMNTSWLGNVGCSTLTLNSEIIRNSVPTFETSGLTTTPAQTGCNNGTGRPMSLENFQLSLLSSEEGSSESFTKFGTANISFTQHWPSEVVCQWKGTGVKFSYFPGSDVVTFENATGLTSTGGCGTAKLSAKFAFVKAGSATKAAFR